MGLLACLGMFCPQVTSLDLHWAQGLCQHGGWKREHHGQKQQLLAKWNFWKAWHFRTWALPFQSVHMFWRALTFYQQAAVSVAQVSGGEGSGKAEREVFTEILVERQISFVWRRVSVWPPDWWLLRGGVYNQLWGPTVHHILTLAFSAKQAM